MRSSKLLLGAISVLVIAQSCTRQKGYFAIVSQNHAEKPFVKPEKQPVVEQIQTKETSPIENVEPTLTASNTAVLTLEKAVKNTKYEKEVKTLLSKVESSNSETKINSKSQKLNFAQKFIVKKIQKKMANTAKPVGFHDWNPFLKIGVILLGIGIVLAIFGLGAVGGIAAFIGLIFTILGLLGSV
ncbi:MAG: hypothetical protein V4585_20215 [Bacteroidota bacterium]|jgi:hypothetical protein